MFRVEDMSVRGKSCFIDYVYMLSYRTERSLTSPAMLARFKQPSAYSLLSHLFSFSPTTFKNAVCTCSVKSPACRLLPFSLNASLEHSLVIALPP
jgi:hypothetical protein